jgi:hypothetical protein
VSGTYRKCCVKFIKQRIIVQLQLYGIIVIIIGVNPLHYVHYTIGPYLNVEDSLTLICLKRPTETVIVSCEPYDPF